MRYIPVLIIARWPESGGHVGETNLYSGYFRARSKDDRFWLVKRKGIFRRWQWLPRQGTYISIYLTEEKGA